MSKESLIWITGRKREEVKKSSMIIKARVSRKSNTIMTIIMSMTTVTMITMDTIIIMITLKGLFTYLKSFE